MWFAPLNEIREYFRIPQDGKRKDHSGFHHILCGIGLN